MSVNKGVTMENQSSNKILLAIVAVAVIAIGGMSIFAVTRNNEETTESVSSNITTTTQEAQEETTPAPTENIVGLAVATPTLSTLVSAVQAADLVETLSGMGPFTVFAPTNDAFANLPAGTLDTILLPANKATLSGILTYHVVAGKVMSSDLKDGQVITTVQGNTLTVSIMGGKVSLTDAKGGKSTVALADVDATNGVVHVIDSVLLPQ